MLSAMSESSNMHSKLASLGRHRKKDGKGGGKVLDTENLSSSKSTSSLVRIIRRVASAPNTKQLMRSLNGSHDLVQDPVPAIPSPYLRVDTSQSPPMDHFSSESRSLRESSVAMSHHSDDAVHYQDSSTTSLHCEPIIRTPTSSVSQSFQTSGCKSPRNSPWVKDGAQIPVSVSSDGRIGELDYLPPRAPFRRTYSTNSIRSHSAKVSPSSFSKLKLLGKGDVGKVYLVREKQSERLFAMKGHSLALLQYQSDITFFSAE